MTETTIDKVIDLIESQTGDRYRKFMLKALDFIGGNEHIQNPLNLMPDMPSMINREKPLKGDEIVYGDYLLYDCCGHDGTELIFSYDSLKEVEDHIMGDAGILNMFTTNNIAIVFGEVKRYGLINNNKELRWID